MVKSSRNAGSIRFVLDMALKLIDYAANLRKLVVIPILFKEFLTIAGALAPRRSLAWL